MVPLSPGLGGVREEGEGGDGHEEEADEDVGERVGVVALHAGPHLNQLGGVHAPVMLLGGALDVSLVRIEDRVRDGMRRREVPRTGRRTS